MTLRPIRLPTLGYTMNWTVKVDDCFADRV